MIKLLIENFAGIHCCPEFRCVLGERHHSHHIKTTMWELLYWLVNDKQEPLIDVVLWGLYGETRTSCNDNDLIQEGADSMSVCIQFEVDGKLYEIVRLRSRRGRGGVSALALHDLTENIDITKGTIRETQTFINQLLLS